MKNIQIKYFINGLILLFLALCSITHLPIILKEKCGLIFENYIYVELEFFLLVACAIFYLFSPKYYQYQIYSIIFGIIYYSFFVKFCPTAL
jgi:hypothetical protein